MYVEQPNASSSIEHLGYRLSKGLFIFSVLLTTLLVVAISTVAQATLTSAFGIVLGLGASFACICEMKQHRRR